MAYCVHCGKEVPGGETYCPACGRPAASGGLARTGKSPAVWIAIAAGCLVLAVAFLGIVAAILVPNFLDALQKAKQKRTMGDLRNLGTAIESYRVDEGEAPPADSVAGLTEYLVPTYLESVPETDGWENPIRYVCWSEDPVIGGCTTYRLVSGGRDGVLEHEDLQAYGEAPFPPTDYDRDLVLADGYFVRYPQGAAGGS
jgi:general secretion pathway protein G